MVERVVFPFRGSELGGSHVATFTLAKGIQRRSAVECIVVCPADTLIAREARKHGLQVIANGERPTGRNNLLTDFSRVGARRRVLAEIPAAGTVVHCNDINTLRSWGLAARLAGMSVVYHHHALNRMWWPPHLISLSYADAVICISDNTLNAMKGWRGDAVKELNPFELDAGFDRARTREALLIEFGWPKDARIVGWIGNFWERKRPFFFLEVAAELARRDARARFVMFGRGGDHSLDEVHAKAKALGVDGVTAFPGFRQPVEANLASLDLLLAPAPREPFGRALVEAILLGTPVVATEGAGHSEILATWGGGQLASEAASAARVAGYCAIALASPDDLRLPAFRRAELAAGLLPEAHADRVLAIYRKAVSRRPQAVMSGAT